MIHQHKSHLQRAVLLIAALLHTIIIQGTDSSQDEEIKIPRNLMELKWSTSPYECAVLSLHIYNTYNIDEDPGGQDISIQLESEKQPRHLHGWKVYKLFYPKSISSGKVDYQAGIYQNKDKKQMVLAYRGTRGTSFDDLSTDVLSVGLSHLGGREKETFSLLEKLQEATYSQEDGDKYSSTITGHSLGGWLAQLAILMASHDRKERPARFNMEHPLKVITFDSPGAEEAMKEMHERLDNKEDNIDLLDITNYYYSPNAMNCTHTSPGSRYRIVFQDFSGDNYWKPYTFKSHKMERFVESFNTQNGSPSMDYSNLTDKQLFGVLYPNRTYKTSLYDRKLIHARHIPYDLRKWIIDQAKKKEFEALKNYLFPYEGKEEEFWYTKMPLFDIRCIVDFLLSFQKSPNPDPSLLKIFVDVKEIEERIQNSEIPLNNLPAIDENVNTGSRSQECDMIEESLKKRPRYIIRGYPGVGKSTLARLYAHKHLYQRTYKHIWWIDFTTLNESFQQVVNSLTGEKYNTNMPTEKQQKEYIKKVLERLSEWLLIIDNVPEHSSIETLLPKQAEKTHVLITTRDARAIWNHLGALSEIGGLSEEDAYNYLVNFASPKDQQEQGKVYDLAKALDYTPLALRNAGYNMRSQKSSETPYADYLDSFQEEKREIKAQNMMLETEEGNKQKTEKEKKAEETIWATYLKIIRDIAMKEEKDVAEDALYMLTIMAYLDAYGLTPDLVAHIPPWKPGFFRYYLDRPIGKNASETGINILEKYGLFSPREHRIHEFCQYITRIWSQDILNNTIKKHRTHAFYQRINRICGKNIFKITTKQPPQHYRFMHDRFPRGKKSIYEGAVKLLENVQKKATLASSLRLIGIDHARALMKHIDHDMKSLNNHKLLSNRLLCVIAFFQAQAYPLGLYIPPQCKEKGKEQSSDMYKKVKSFIKGQYSLFGLDFRFLHFKNYTPSLLITGEGSIGKSTYAAYLTQELAKKYNSLVIKDEGSIGKSTYATHLKEFIKKCNIKAKIWASHIPIFIFLPAYIQEDEKLSTDLMSEVLKSYGMGASSINTLKKNAQKGKQPLVVIMDAYDEANLKQNIYTHYKLNDWGTKYNKYIINCRSNYFAKHLQATDYDRGNLFSLNKYEAREFEICAFKQEQIDPYIKKFVESDYNKKKGQKIHSINYYKNKLTEPLREMADKPFMLCTILLSIPKIKSDNPSLYEVYSAFTQVWLDREMKKSNVRVDSASIEKFCEKLGFGMWYKNVNSLKVNDQEMSRFFKNPEFIHAPLRFTSNDQYSFFQPIYRDFFAAQYMLKKHAGKKYIQQKILNEDFVLFLTKGRYQHQKDKLQKECWEEIEAACQKKGNGIEASYCLQLLYYINRENLQDQDLSGIDLQGGNLSGLDLSSTEMVGAILSNQNLTEEEVTLPLNLSKCDLTDAQLPTDLAKYNLKGAILIRQDLTKITLPENLSDCNLIEAQLPKDLSKYDLTGANLSGQDLRDMKIPDNLSKCNLTGAQLPQNLSKCNLKGAILIKQNLKELTLPNNLSECDLTESQLPKDLSKYYLNGAIMVDQDLSDVTLPKDLSDCNLTGVNLRGHDLTDVILPCNLSKCDLREAQLPRDLSGYKLTNVNLKNQDLKNIILPEDLSQCDLIGADMSGKNLTKVNLPKNLSDCNLTATNLSGQDLTDVKLPDDLSKCDLRKGTKLPYDLSKYNLTGANLTDQNLTEVTLPKDLSACNLIGAQLPKDLSEYNLRGANLSGQDLRNMKLPGNLSECNLSGAQLPKDLSQYDLRGANLNGQDLRGMKLPSDLSDCNLTGVNLSGQDLTDVTLPKDLSQCNLVDTNLSNQDITDVILPQDLSKCNLVGTQLPKDLSQCNLVGADLRDQDLTDLKLPQDLSQCNLVDAQLPKDLSKYNLIGANLNKQDLTGVVLPNDLSECSLEESNLSGQNFKNVILPKDLSQCSLVGANLSDQDLTSVKLPQDLSKCDLTGAKLPQDLSKYNLVNASLSNQDLTKITPPKNLSGCNLIGAQLPKDLSEHDLRGADLRNQNLKNITLPGNLSKCNLTGAQLPKDFSKYDLRGANLSGQDLRAMKLPSDLSDCNLTDVNLSGQNLTEVILPNDLSACNLVGADLRNKDFKYVKLPKDLSKCDLTGAQLPSDLSKYDLKGSILVGQNLSNLILPKSLLACDLTNANLTGQDLTGYSFSNTNLIDAQLDGTILADTTCDYENAFYNNIEANACNGSGWYRHNLSRDLKSIAEVYPKLEKDADKASLLPIVSGLSQLPFYEGREFYIKTSYWSCALLRLQQRLGEPYGSQLNCSLEENLKYNADNYCWQTEYPEGQLSIDDYQEELHDDFDRYLKDFDEGLQEYNCKSEQGWAFQYYKNQIEKNIQGLQKSYPIIKNNALLGREAHTIARALSKSYRMRTFSLLFHYLFYQNRLINFKNSAHQVDVKNNIYYNFFPGFVRSSGWIRFKK